MKWYTGTIPEAVAHAQTKKSLFCVAILGADSDSKALLASLESELVQQLIIREDVVAIRIGAETEEHQQFGAIYTNVTAPSIYCITMGGLVVETIKGPADPGELKSKFEEAFSRHSEAIRLASGPVSATESAPYSAALEASASATGNSNNPTAVPAQEHPPLDERIERAKRLATAKQQQKKEEEAEEAKRLEAERREAGKKVAELKRWQMEEETKRVAEERRKDKQEEAALRQRLREQIAQDRIDRETRSNANNKKAAESPPTAPTVPTNYTGLARLQFRLPDGSSHTHAFDPDNTLGSVREYLTSNIAVPPQGFSIWVAFPRRELSSTDYGTSLRDLGLLPSAALLIIPAAENRILPRLDSGGRLMSMLSVVFLLLLSPFTYVWSLIRPGGTPTPGNSGSTNEPKRSRPTIPNRSGNILGGTAEPTAGPSGQSALRNRGAAGKNEDKAQSLGTQDGNIHRLRTTESDSDDELGTYNGNSTQQM